MLYIKVHNNENIVLLEKFHLFIFFNSIYVVSTSARICIFYFINMKGNEKKFKFSSCNVGLF